MSDNATNNKQEPERIKVSFLPSSNKLGGIILKYLLKTKMVTAMGMKSAWVTAGFPVELCYGFGIHPMHPENAACIAGSRKLENVPGKPPLSLKYIELAESMGYSRDEHFQDPILVDLEERGCFFEVHHRFRLVHLVEAENHGRAEVITTIDEIFELVLRFRESA